ncbi:MAG: HAMP domain-containing sensor histidine kinase [Clostridia bacterium]
MKNKLKENKEIKSILSIVIIVNLLVVVIGYFLLPVVFNYPKYSLNTQFQQDIINLTYNQQFLIFGALYMLFSIAIPIIFLRKLMPYQKILKAKELNLKDVDNIRNQCMKCPMKIYLSQIILPILLVLVVSIFCKATAAIFLKLLIIVFIFVVGSGMYVYIVSRKYYDQIIIKTYNRVKDYEFIQSELYSLKNVIFIQIFPLFVVAIVVSMLLGYTRVINEKGESKYYYYSSVFSNDIILKEGATLTTIKDDLSKIKLKDESDYYFIIFPNNYEYISNPKGHISTFFKEYLKRYYDLTNGKGYEFYGTDEQAFVRKLYDASGNEWYIGFKYSVTDSKVLVFFGISFLSLLFVYITIIYIWAKSFSLNVKRIVRNLNDILKENTVDFDNVIPITSYDEIGSLADSYNKVQYMIEEQIELIQKQAQLATLGELAGNMAHDINTPMASIDNSIAMLNDIIKDNGTIEAKDLEVIVGIMGRCSDKINRIVNSMRNQVRTLGESEIYEFNLKNVIDESILMLNTDIVQINCNVITKVKDINVKGQPNKIGQVITALLLNSLQAYKILGKTNEIIEVKLTSEKGNAVIEIKDYANGLPEAIRPYIFKNILTTKGTNGTGLGLYLAYSIIKGVFGGTIEFETETGKGTTFIIRIPLEK